jgi:hypothetical protein
MLADELHLVDHARNDRVYRKTGGDARNSTRTLIGSAPGLPQTLEVHQNPGTGKDAIDRHNVTLTRQKMAADGITKKRAVISTTISNPQDGTFTTAELKSMLSEAIYLLRAARADLDAAPETYTFSDSLEPSTIMESLVFGET